MWAEKLLNRSFEIFPPYKRDVFKWSRSHPEYDLTREDWRHTGYEHNHWYAVDTAYAKLTNRRYWGFYHGLQAARLENKAQSKKPTWYKTVPTSMPASTINSAAGFAREM